MYKLQKNIPIPSRATTKQARTSKYPFAAMKVNMSFLVPKEEANGDIDKLMTRISAAAHSARKALNFKFALRKMPEGVRVWRTQ